MATDLSKSKYISTCGVNDKTGKTQETPCSLSSVINMWLRFGCQIKFLQNYILSDLLKSKSKFALKVNTANFPYSARPSPLPCSTVDSGCIRDKWLLTHCPFPHPGERPAQGSPQESWEEGMLSRVAPARFREEHQAEGAKFCVSAVATCPLSLIVRKGVTHVSHSQ